MSSARREENPRPLGQPGVDKPTDTVQTGASRRYVNVSTNLPKKRQNSQSQSSFVGSILLGRLKKGSQRVKFQRILLICATLKQITYRGRNERNAGS